MYVAWLHILRRKYVVLVQICLAVSVQAISCIQASCDCSGYFLKPSNPKSNALSFEDTGDRCGSSFFFGGGGEGGAGGGFAIQEHGGMKA